jgi:hypothetical protein
MSVVGPPTHVVRREGAIAVNIGKFYCIDEVAESRHVQCVAQLSARN